MTHEEKKFRARSNIHRHSNRSFGLGGSAGFLPAVISGTRASRTGATESLRGRVATTGGVVSEFVGAPVLPSPDKVGNIGPGTEFPVTLADCKKRGHT